MLQAGQHYMQSDYGRGAPGASEWLRENQCGWDAEIKETVVTVRKGPGHAVPLHPWGIFCVRVVGSQRNWLKQYKQHKKREFISSYSWKGQGTVPFKYGCIRGFQWYHQEFVPLRLLAVFSDSFWSSRLIKSYRKESSSLWMNNVPGWYQYQPGIHRHQLAHSN